MKMAAFGNFGRNIKGVKDSVAGKAKDLSGISRLNGQISAAEKQIAELYSTVGRIYYENHKSDPAPEAAQQIRAISELYKRVAEAQDAIKKIKGIEKCPRCGADVAVGAQFCSACGQKIERSAPGAGHRFCTNCGAPLEPSMAFCTNCGAQVDNAPVAVWQETPAPAPAVGFCANCGAPLEPDMSFCIQCGTPVDQPDAAPAAPEPAFPDLDLPDLDLPDLEPAEPAQPDEAPAEPEKDAGEA